jgi:long-chain acyl-CoA synthetase
MNIANAFLKVAESKPKNHAMTFEEHTWMYEDIASLVQQWGMFFQENIEKGERVLLISENRPEVMAIYLAVAGAGGVFVPVNPQLTDTEVIDIVNRTQPSYIITSILINTRMKALITDIKIKGLENYTSSTFEIGMRFSEFNEQKGCLICFSSGSTGKPKAIFASHQNEYTSTKQYGYFWGINQADVILITSPLSFVYGLTTGCLTALFAGAHIVLAKRFHPCEALEMIEEYKVNVFIGVPTMYTMMLDVQSNAKTKYNTGSLRLMLTAGAPISNEVLDQFEKTFNIEIWNFYALSEIRPIFTFDVNREDQFKRGACGKKVAEIDAKLIDDAGHEITEPGVQGELIAKSKTLMLGYYDDKELTNTTIRDGWFYTGDLAQFDDEDNFYITGRKKEMIIRGGVNISPAEIEEHFYTNPAILEACVVGVKDKVFDQEILAVLVLKDHALLTEEQVREEASIALAEYKIPKYVSFVKNIPKNNSGKINKKKVKAQWESSVLQQPN